MDTALIVTIGSLGGVTAFILLTVKFLDGIELAVMEYKLQKLLADN